MTTRRVQAGIPAGGRFAPTAHSESDVALDSQQWVSIGDPDNSMNPPLYEGSAGQAGHRLSPGSWEATDEDGHRVQVIVPSQDPAVATDTSLATGPPTLQTPMAVINSQLAAAIAQGDRSTVGVLSTFAAARLVYGQNPDCSGIDLERGSEGLRPVSAHTAFGDRPPDVAEMTPGGRPRRGAVDLSQTADYLANLKPGDPGTRGRIVPAAVYSSALYQLDVHATLGIAPF